METGRGYGKGDGKTKKGGPHAKYPPSRPVAATSSGLAQLPPSSSSSSSSWQPPSSSSSASSSWQSAAATGFEPAPQQHQQQQQQQQQVALTPPTIATNISLARDWFISPIPESEAPAAKSSCAVAAPAAVYTDDDLFDEPDSEGRDNNLQLPAAGQNNWENLMPMTPSSSSQSYIYPDGSTTEGGTAPPSLSFRAATASVQSSSTPQGTLSSSHHSSVPTSGQGTLSSSHHSSVPASGNSGQTDTQ